MSLVISAGAEHWLARSQRLLAWVVVMAALGCGDDDISELPAASGPELGQVTPDAGSAAVDAGPDAASPAKPSSPWCAARAVFESACNSCHGSTLAAGAPMPLVTFADLQAEAPISKGKKVHEVVKARVHDLARPMPPQRKLSAEELAAIDGWIDGGAQQGDDPNCTSGAGIKASAQETTPATWPPQGCEQIYEIRAGNGQKAVVPAGQETHPQFYIDAPWGDDDVQALGFRPITDNAKVLHHWIVYENKGPQGPFIVGWAPGQDDTQQRKLPDNVGVYLPKGPQSLRLDMHYFNSQGTQDELDASGVEVCVTRNFRPITASTFQGFTAIPYIAPGQEKDMIGTCKVNLTEPVFLMTSSPHAHTLATWAKLVIHRGNEKIVLHDTPFHFEEQTSTPLTPFFELKQGDVVKTTCHYKNDTARYVIFGESTTSEMCFNFATYFPMGALSCDPSGLLGG